MSTRVIIVDDHPFLLKGLRQALDPQSNLTVVGEALSGLTALQLVREATPDLVLLDIHLPDLNGIEVSRQILAEHPAVKIIVFSSDANRLLVDEALQAGVCGYLLKNAAADELNRAISTVLEGRLYLCPELASSVISDHIKRIASTTAPSKPILSERDRQILRFVAEGLPNKEIADRLKVGINSVEKYRSQLMRTLGVRCSAELIRYAIREGIAPC
jgi:DNA-binding NarL/FixJ family response regulator